MSELFDDGLTMEQASPDLNEGDVASEATESTEGFEFEDSKAEEAPVADNKSETKRVSDRINAIRAESSNQIQALQDQLAERDAQLLKYRAQEEGITEQELAARDKMEEENFRNALHNDPEFIALQQRDFERQKAEVLTQLQESFPKDGIQDLDALPAVFFRQLQAGVDPVTAYRASVAEAQKETPPSTGSVKSKGVATPGNITEEQALSMSVDDWKEYLNANDE